MHNKSHAMTDTSNHSAGNWKLFYSNDSAAVVELALGAAGKPLLSGGAAAAPVFGTLLLATDVVNAAGATPEDTDVSAWANDTIGIVVGTGARVWFAHKNAADVYYTEMTGI